MRKLLITVLLVGIAGSVAGSATFSAFSSTTSNSGNSFAAGTVLISDNDAGSVLYSVSNQAPNSPAVVKCIKVTYTGTLPADVKLYTGSTTNTLDTYVNLTIEKGTIAGAPAFPSCTGFSAQSTLYNGTLSGFAAASNTYATGVASYPGSQTQWNQNDSLYYRFTLSLQDDNNANGGASPLSAASRTFTWEARNQ
jgi:predicted ribosomally synthesized peptide with SipW-like signal peptide